MRKVIPSATVFSIAMVWFTSHFGGGFASGQQVVLYFSKYGIYSLITPFLSLALLTFIYYQVWDHAVENKTYNYLSWAKSYYKPYEKVFATAFDIMFIIALTIGVAVAIATGASTISKVVGNSYLMNAAIIGFTMFILTIYGSELIRKTAFVTSILIIFGLLMVFGSNIVTNFDNIARVIAEAPKPLSFLDALWHAFIYVGFQTLLLGGIIAVLDGLNNRAEVKQSIFWGMIINTVFLMLAVVSMLGFYPEATTAPVPTLYVIENGAGGQLSLLVLSILIVLGVITTGVNVMFGAVRRISASLPDTFKHKNSIVALILIIISFGVAQFGLIPLVAKGYAFLGYGAMVIIIAPTLVIFFNKKKSSNKVASETESIS